MKKEDNPKKIKTKPNLWPVIVLVFAIVLSFTFSLLSELTLSKATIAVSIIVIIIFVVISIIFDMVGLAVASCSLEPFTAMASRKIKGSKQAIHLIKNADRVSSICNDVVGDVCGILSGAAGASILAKIAITQEIQSVLIASLVSAIIAGLTIFGKALFKRVAIKNCNEITLALSKILNFFTRKG